jgi:transposase
MRSVRTYAIVARHRKSQPSETARCQYLVSKSLYALRSRIECFIGHLKEQRRIATRFDKTASSFLGFVLLGCSRIWIRLVYRA